MKKTMMKVLACGLCAAMLSGCNHNGEKNSANLVTTVDSTKDEQKDNVQTTSVELIKKMKAKYAGTETAEYTEPMYNVEKNHVFTYENLPEKFFEQEEYDCFAVYYDSDLKHEADISISKDYENKSVTISPGMVFCYDDREGSTVDDGTWGSRTKFWLVRNVDLQNGEMLSKPVITVFTTKEEMDTPTLTQTVNENGAYTLSWSEVEGADYYEVYEYWEADCAFLEVTTKNTSCTYDEFQTAKEHEEHFRETYKDTEIDVTEQWAMNDMLDSDRQYFVVAKSDDGKKSGVSNICMAGDIGNQIPVRISDTFKKEYEGDNTLALPAYADIEMLDGSVGKFLIQYHNAKVSLLEDGRIYIECKVKNLPIEMYDIMFSGMEYEDFLNDTENVTKREDALAAKTITTKNDINIPYLPDKDYETSVDENTTATLKPGEPTEPGETVEMGETTEPGEMVEPEEPTEPGETVEPEETTEPENMTGSQSQLSFSEEAANMVYANSALSEWIAINMLAHQEEIYLGDFAESSDSEKLMDALLEAYNQNPLIGIMEHVNYNYEKNVLEVKYVLSAEETEKMQEESLKKADEIVKNIIRTDMDDYEKEEAIHQYICENGSYNNEIMNYINEDGTIDPEAAVQFANSFTPYGILVENKGVCESYAEAFLLLAKKAGLDAVIVTGTLEGVNHEWNRVNIDGQWYSLDSTNNDSDTVPNCYFNLPDELAGTMLLQDKDAFIDSCVSQYTAEDMNQEYYTKNGLTTDDSNQAAELLAAEISKKDVAAIRVQEEIDEKTVEEIAQNVCNQSGISECWYYYKAGVVSIIKK